MTCEIKNICLFEQSYFQFLNILSRMQNLFLRCIEVRALCLSALQIFPQVCLLVIIIYFTNRVYSVLKEAQAVGMMTAYHNYLITNLVITVIIETRTFYK
jgi:hypothetical protein